MTQSANMATELSRALAAAVADAARSVVRVDARHPAASGTVWSADGVIVMASHALEDEDELGVALEGGRTLPARLVGRDHATDVAVLRIDASDLVPARFGDDEPSVGQLLLAVTRPGRSARAALGVLGAVGPADEGWRTPGGGRVERYLEADVALQPGLSGGLAVDASGRALGVLTSGLARGRAIVLPPATLRRVVAGLLAHGAVRRGYLGVATLPVRLGPALESALGQPSGVLLTAVEPDSPAASAGLLLGDTVVSFDGSPVLDVGDLLAALDDERLERVAPLRVVRAGRLEEHTVKVGVRGTGGER